MYLTKEKKSSFFETFGKSKFDTGSSEGRHLKKNKKDLSTRRSLVLMVGKRRRLLDYLKKNDIERYRSIIKELGLRK